MSALAPSPLPSHCCHVDVMECVTSPPEHTRGTCSHLVSEATKPQLFPLLHMSQDVFGERPRTYLENTGKKIQIKKSVCAVMDNNSFFSGFVFFFSLVWLTTAKVKCSEASRSTPFTNSFLILQRLNWWHIFGCACTLNTRDKKHKMHLILKSSQASCFTCSSNNSFRVYDSIKSLNKHLGG